MIIFFYIILLILVLIVVLKALSSLFSIIIGAPSVDSSGDSIRQALKLANLKKGEKLYDLGSSNGQVLKIASRDFDAMVTGLEIAPFPYLVSKINCLGQKNIIIKFKNMYKEDLSDADVIYCYLLPGLMKKLSQKFKLELKSGTRVVANSFMLPDRKPIKIIKVKKCHVFLYQY